MFCSILFGFGMGRPRTHTASKMEPFVKKVNSWKSLLLLERAPSPHLLYNISIHILSQSKGNDKTGTFDRFFSVKNFYALKLWLTLIKKNWSRWKIKLKKTVFADLVALCGSSNCLILFKLSQLHFTSVWVWNLVLKQNFIKSFLIRYIFLLCEKLWLKVQILWFIVVNRKLGCNFNVRKHKKHWNG